MPRPIVVVFLLMMIVLTSIIELKPRVANEVAAVTAPNPHSLRLSESQDDSHIKEKIILEQEHSIRKLNELVRTLKEHLEICRTRTENDTTTYGAELLGEMELQ